MTYEHRPGRTPASPDIDMGMPEICEKCNRDCPEPCEALKRVVAVTTHLKDRIINLGDAYDFECETLRMEFKDALKSLESQESSQNRQSAPTAKKKGE